MMANLFISLTDNFFFFCIFFQQYPGVTQLGTAEADLGKLNAKFQVIGSFLFSSLIVSASLTYRFLFVVSSAL